MEIGPIVTRLSQIIKQFEGDEGLDLIADMALKSIPAEQKSLFIQSLQSRVARIELDVATFNEPSTRAEYKKLLRRIIIGKISAIQKLWLPNVIKSKSLEITSPHRSEAPAKKKQVSKNVAIKANDQMLSLKVKVIRELDLIECVYSNIRKKIASELDDERETFNNCNAILKDLKSNVNQNQNLGELEAACLKFLETYNESTSSLLEFTLASIAIENLRQ